MNRAVLAPAFLALFLAGCATPGDIGARTARPFRNNPAHFQFAIVADRTGGHREGVFEDAIRKLNLLQPEFVLCVGDLIEGYTEDRDTLDREYDEMDAILDELDMTFFRVAGNHDITNDLMAQMYRDRYGSPYYHFVYKDVLFLIVCTEDPPPANISDDQISYLRRALEENRDVRWTLAFMHRPLFVEGEGDAYRAWERIELMLKGRPHTVFAGHWHNYAKREKHGHSYIRLASTGGASPMRGPEFGEFDHVVWATMTREGPLLANLMLDGIADENIRTEYIAEIMYAMERNATVAIEPIFADTASFRAGTTRILLTNQGTFPLRIEGVFEDMTSLAVQPSSISTVVPPASTESIQLDVQALAHDGNQERRPAVLKWNVAYIQREGKVPSIEGASTLDVVTPFRAVRRNNAVNVDGDLAEWSALPFDVTVPADIDGEPSAWQGPQDCSFRFGVELDDRHLYIALQVIDDKPVYKGAHAWYQDGIEVRIDGRSDPERSNNRGQDENDGHLFVSIGTELNPEDSVMYRADVVEGLGVQAICVPTRTGHNTEIAVPLAYFEDRQGATWDAFRLNITVDDYDEVEGPLSQLWWQPDWRDPESFAGSGTFTIPSAP